MSYDDQLIEELTGQGLDLRAATCMANEDQQGEYAIAARAQYAMDLLAARVPVTCPRCKRRAVGWPVLRGDRCSPRDWVDCIRDPGMILALDATRPAASATGPAPLERAQSRTGQPASLAAQAGRHQL